VRSRSTFRFRTFTHLPAEYIEHEKQFQEKEAVRAAILEEEAYQLRLKKERQKQEAKEWKERQRAWEHKIATERRSEEEARRKARSAHERRFAHEPGHGPTRWLWPTAREHPRAWIANADIPLKPEDQKESIAWQASPAARVRVDKSVRQTPRV
jgi:hypothetical protein